MAIQLGSNDVQFKDQKDEDLEVRLRDIRNKVRVKTQDKKTLTEYALTVKKLYFADDYQNLRGDLDIKRNNVEILKNGQHKRKSHSKWAIEQSDVIFVSNEKDYAQQLEDLTHTIEESEKVILSPVLLDKLFGPVYNMLKTMYDQVQTFKSSANPS